MTWDLHDFRLVTASAYPGMMAPLTKHPSCICVLAGDADRHLVGRAEAAPLLSLEALDGVRRRWRFGDVARLSDFVPKVLADAAPDDRPILLIPPRASVAWAAAVAAWPGRVRLAASPIAVVERIAEDKILVRAALRRLGVPVPDELVLSSGALDFSSIRAQLGVPFVLQAPSGAGGQGTYLISDAGALAAALFRQPHVDRWLASRHAGYTTINVAGVIHVDGTQLLPISVQASGIAELGFDFGAYCGSDFATLNLPAGVRREAYRHAATVGQWLREQGHRGLFGADVAVSGDNLAFLEINPRIQGSSWLLSKLQQARGTVPCLEQHVQALLGRPLGLSGDVSIPAEAVPLGSHLIIRWTGPAGVVCQTPISTDFDLPGVPGAAVGVSGLPGTGITLLPGAIIARLESGHSLASPDGRRLLPATRHLVDRLMAGLEVVPSSE